MIHKAASPFSNVVTDCDGFQGVFAITVPAGTWLVTGGLTFADHGNAASKRHTGRTRLRAGNTEIDGSRASVSLVEDATPDDTGTVPLGFAAPRGVVTTTSPSTTISLDACRMDTTGLKAGRFRLDALRVETATAQ